MPDKAYVVNVRSTCRSRTHCCSSSLCSHVPQPFYYIERRHASRTQLQRQIQVLRRYSEWTTQLQILFEAIQDPGFTTTWRQLPEAYREQTTGSGLQHWTGNKYVFSIMPVSITIITTYITIRPAPTTQGSLCIGWWWLSDATRTITITWRWQRWCTYRICIRWQ